MGNLRAMIALIIIGLILLLVGMYVAMPAPLPVILKIIGAVLLVWGLILLALYFTHRSGADVDVDGMRALLPI